MSAESSTSFKADEVRNHVSCTTKMKFVTHSFRWTIENFEFISKNVKSLKSHEFPLDGPDVVEEEKWYIHLKPQKLTHDSQEDCVIRIRRTFSKQIYVQASLSLKTSFGQNYGFPEFHGVLGPTHCLIYNVTGKDLYKKLHWGKCSDKALIITCEVRVLQSTEDVCLKIPNIHLECSESSDFLQDMSKMLLNDQTFKDITITVEGKIFGAHKNILAARSEVFAAMFSHEMSENINSKIKIEDMEAETVEKMLLFIYTDQVDDLDLKKLAPELLAAAEKYDLKRLKEMCISSMHKNLEVETVLKTLEIADIHSIPDLKNAALKFLVSHCQVVKGQSEFKTLITRRPSIMVEFIDIQDNQNNSKGHGNVEQIFESKLEFRADTTDTQ